MIFLDTSGLFSCLSPDEEHHQLAVALLKTAKAPSLIHSSILTEFVALADARGENRKNALDFVTTICNSSLFKVVWLTESDHRHSLNLLIARPDKNYSLCDAASFILMRRMNIHEALTTDHHFQQEGFVRLLK